jgi:D-alanyl-lipoteichoic acid acyltransferase DltB (MBOAT superfamily)
MFGSFTLILALVSVTLLTYWCGLNMLTGNYNARKWWLRIGILGNVIILVVMKYLPFIVENVHSLAVIAGYSGFIKSWPTILSVGVSFYVFQAIGYLLDIDLELQEPERNLVNFSLSLSFFPKLLQGPIESCADLLSQFQKPYEFNYDNVRSGILLFIWGLFKKLVIADRLGLFANEVYGNVNQYSGVSLFLGTYAYAFQLYFDFAAYTDMAIGTARLFNINLTPNFNSPYLATSVSDFWRRWHISFSRWILNYLFRPLQMRWRDLGRIGTAVALLVTFLVSGIWHGASWCFVVWGVLHGVYLALSIFWKPYQKELHKRIGKASGWVLTLWQTIITFHLVCFAWIFFRAKTLSDAWYIITHLFPSSTNNRLNLHALFLNQSSREVIVISICLLFMTVIGFVKKRSGVGEMVDFVCTMPYLIRWGLYTMLCMVILVFGIFTSSTFIYYRF